MLPFKQSQVTATNCGFAAAIAAIDLSIRPHVQQMCRDPRLMTHYIDQNNVCMFELAMRLVVILPTFEDDGGVAVSEEVPPLSADGWQLAKLLDFAETIQQQGEDPHYLPIIVRDEEEPKLLPYASAGWMRAKFLWFLDQDVFWMMNPWFALAITAVK